MSDAGEVGVELRLKTGKLAQDIRSGAQKIRSQMPNANLASSSGIKSNAEIEREFKILRWQRLATESRLRDMRNARRGSGGGGPGGGPGSGDTSSYYGFSDRGATILKTVAAFITLRKVINEVANAVDSAARRYSKQLTSGGMAGGFITRRESLSKIIGVSEQQVMQYGSAVAYLNKQLDWSTDIFTKTGPALTDTSWKFKVMMLNIEAAFSNLASKLKPFLDEIANLASSAAKGASSAIDRASQQSQMQMFLTEMRDAGRIIGGDVATYEKKDEYGRGTGQFTFNEMGTFGPGQELPQFMEEFKKWVANLPKTEVPAASVSTQRMPGSAWERMGLIIGQGGGADKPATERTLKEMVSQLRLIATGGGIPRTGMPVFDRNTAMP